MSTQVAVAEKNVRPFLKWAGGKAKTLPQYEPYFPERFNAYHEPFLGGGAVFFHLQGLGKISNAYLSDLNFELIQTCWVIRDNPDLLCELLSEHQKRHSEQLASSDYYYQIRALDRDPLEMSSIERAARMIYLNKTCFNGLYRRNSSEQFNTPVGRYIKPTILDRENIHAVSEAFQKIALIHGSFSGVLERAQPGDFVYLDPPYHVPKGGTLFNRYTGQGFSQADHEDLARTFQALTDRGIHVALSNSDTEFVRNLYKAWEILPIQGNRSINSNAKGRSSVLELLVRNYSSRHSVE